MKIYKGNKGIVGFIAFTLTGIIYSLFGISSKIVGKILFSIFVVAIPAIFKFIIGLLR